MAKKDDNTKSKIVFDKNIDSSINGFSLVCAFFIVGLFLQFNGDFFGIATNWVKIIFIIFGFIGLCTEISNLNDKMQIKGFDNVSFGIVFLIITYLMKFYVDISKWWKIFAIPYTILIFIFMFITIYLISEGIIQIIYSIYIRTKNKENKKKSLFSGILVVLTQLGSLALIVAQIYDIFN